MITLFSGRSSSIFLINYLLSLVLLVFCRDQHYNISVSQWEKEYASGNWDYLDRVGIERARNSIIVNMFYAIYGGGSYGSLKSGVKEGESISYEVDKILDVGCGLGTLSDYLHGPQRVSYHGIDLSHTAIEMARHIRANTKRWYVSNNVFIPLHSDQFTQSEAIHFKAPMGIKYGTIVFNEMLYYVNHKDVMKHYIQYLKPNGIIVISVWFNNRYKELRDNIFADARTMFKSIDMVTMSGTTFTGKEKRRMKVSFHVEAFTLLT